MDQATSSVEVCGSSLSRPGQWSQFLYHFEGALPNCFVCAPRWVRLVTCLLVSLAPLPLWEVPEGGALERAFLLCVFSLRGILMLLSVTSGSLIAPFQSSHPEDTSGVNA